MQVQKEGQRGHEEGRQQRTQDKGGSSKETAEQCGNIRTIKRQKMDQAETGPVPGGVAHVWDPST